MANTHALVLDAASSQYAAVANGDLISGDFTIEVWLQLASLPSTTGIMAITSQEPTTANIRNHLLWIHNGDDKIEILFWDSSNNNTRLEMDAAFDADDVGNWIHIAVAVDVSVPSATFYKNGSLSASTDQSTAATSVVDSSADFAVGARDNSGGYDLFFDGKLDDLRIWNDIRTAPEISNNYQKELNGDEAGLVAYYKLNNDYTDETGTWNLTASGSPTFDSEDLPFTGTSRSWSTFGDEGLVS